MLNTQAGTEPAKHTPGPWKHATPGCHAVVVGDKILASAEADSQEAYDQGAIDFTLMAAAPELLVALQELLKVASVRIDDPRIAQWDAARAAITKAGASS